MKRWTGGDKPERILFIRLQATGDMVACLPFIQSVREQLGDNVTIDFLCREEVSRIPLSMHLFNAIHVLKGGRSSRKQLFHLLLNLPDLRKRKYELVIDLQNNRISRICRTLLMPDAWVEYDKYSAIHACQRYSNTISSIGVVTPEWKTTYSFKDKSLGRKLLIEKGWNGSDQLIVINPAGAFATRNWPLDNYVDLCVQLLKVKAASKFLILGLETLKPKARYLKDRLGDSLLDLTGQTTPEQAFSIIQLISLMVSEDSGLMHMAYVSGRATVGLLGSTRNDWTDPKLSYTRFFHSADLSCGNCMRSVCNQPQQVHCLTRLKTADVVKASLELLDEHV